MCPSSRASLWPGDHPVPWRPEINNSKKTASFQEADGCGRLKGILARCCLWLPPLARCLSIESVCLDGFVSDLGALLCC